MAKHKTFEGLGRAVVKISKDIDTNLVNGIRRAVLAMDNILVLTTPVDTGYARSRWVVSIGQPIEAEDGSGINKKIQIGEEVATAIALSQGEGEIKKWKGQGSIFISNPVEYTFYLDQGSSEQAPNGMTEDALAAGIEVLRELKVI